MALDVIEELARPELVFANILGATRILPPLFARPKFFLSQNAHGFLLDEFPANEKHMVKET